MSVQLLLVVIVSASALAQFQEPVAAVPASITLQNNNALLAEYTFWSQTAPRHDERSVPIPTETPKIIGKKNPVLAAGLSLILPGLGEYYVGDEIWRGVIFTALEGGLWYGHFYFDKRGDDSLLAFHAWADSLWSAGRYTDSLEVYLKEAHIDLKIDSNNFSSINKAEDTLDQIGFSDFTHRLPQRGSQQFYELISKYIQFTWGWKDATSRDPLTSFDYQRHADMRANMNQQYDIAGYFIWGMVLNRVLSAIDAVLLARDHNSAIRLEGELVRKPFPNGLIGYVPTAKLRWTF